MEKDPGHTLHGRLPNLLIAGTARAGTTSLHHYLGGHPDVYMCSPKEPRFFSGQVSHFPGKGPGDEHVLSVDTEQEYRRLFAPAGHAAVAGEASPENLYFHRGVVPRIRSLLGQPAIVIMLRQPAERAFSAYLRRTCSGLETLSFEEALLQEQSRRQAGWSSGWYYVGYGYYAEAVEHYLSTFERVYVGIFDDFARDTPAELQQIMSFLGIDASWRPKSFTRHNASGILRVPGSGRILDRCGSRWQGWAGNAGRHLLGPRGWVNFRERLRSTALKKPVMRPDTRQKLSQLYRHDLLRLQGILNRDLSGWFS